MSELVTVMLAAAVIFAAIAYGVYIFSSKFPPAQPGNIGPSGVGGWLLVLVTLLLVIGPLQSLGVIAQLTAFDLERAYGHDQNLWWLDLARLAIFALFIAAITLSIHAGYSLAKKRNPSVVRRAKIIIWILGPVGLLFFAIFGTLLTGSALIFFSPEVIGKIVGSLISAALWTAYLSKSKRVNATYYSYPLSTIASANSLSSTPDKFWAEAAKEYESARDNALWAKSYALSDGDEAKAKAMYIRIRARAIQNDSEISATNLNSDRGYSESAEKNANLALFSLIVVFLAGAYLYVQNTKSTQQQDPVSVDSRGTSGKSIQPQEYVNPRTLMTDSYVTPPSEHNVRKDPMPFPRQTCTLYWTGTEFSQDKSQNEQASYEMLQFLVDHQPVRVGIPALLKDLVSEDPERFATVYRSPIMESCGFR